MPHFRKSLVKYLCNVESKGANHEEHPVSRR